MSNQLQPNTTLYTRSIGDHNCIFTATVLKVTKKMVTFIAEGETKRAKIHTDDDGVQFFFPFGRYSFAPRLRATSTKPLLPDWIQS